MSTQEQEYALLKGLAQNNNLAIETIYRENYNMVQSYILNNNGTADDARDIFQETIMVLYEKASSNTFELTCKIKTYVYSICRRLWLKKLQQLQRRSTQIDSLEEVIAVEEEIETHKKRELDFSIMDSALSKIGEPCKALLEAYYLQNKTMQVIATDFGYTNADNAKTQKYKCLMRLKKIFFAQYKND